MDIIVLLCKQIFVMFIYMFIGVALFKAKLLTRQGSAEIAKLLLYVIMPLSLGRSFLTTATDEMLKALLISFVAGVVVLALSILTARTIFGKKNMMEHFSAAFSNAGFIGIPLIQMTFGQSAVFYIASFAALLNILQWTYGVFIMTEDKKHISFKKIRTNPVVISVTIGLILFFLPIELPDLAVSTIGTLANMNGPLAMIVLGVYLAQTPILSIITDKTAYACAFVRLIFIPVFTVFVLWLVPREYNLMKLAILTAASAPVGSNVAIFAQLFDKDYTRAVKDVCLSTLLCIVTIPLIIAFAEFIWR